jgi:hypothetical protein
MITIRRITIEDAEAYLNLRTQLDYETKFMMLEPGERQITIEQERERLKSLLATDNSMVFLAESDGNPIGFCKPTADVPAQSPQRSYRHHSRGLYEARLGTRLPGGEAYIRARVSSPGVDRDDPPSAGIALCENGIPDRGLR